MLDAGRRGRLIARSEEVWCVETHNDPKAKTTINPSFCLFGIASSHVGNMGKIKTITSPKILAMAPAYQNAVRLMHVPGSALAQTRAMGVHWKIVTRIDAMP